MAIKSFSIEYDAKNKDNVFSRGDSISGRVVLDVSKETKLERLTVKAKGKASVRWTEHYGPRLHITYTAKEKYFSIEKHLLDDSTRGSKVTGVGRHVFPFTFEIPYLELPSSFKGKHGKIVYSLEARASRSMRLDRKAKEEFIILFNEDLSTPDLVKPQHICSDKKLLSSGNVTLNVHTKRMGYLQGDTIEVRAEIINNSNKTITPKYYLYEKQTFYTKLKRKVYTKGIIKEKGQPIGPRAQLNDTKVLHIPDLLPPTLLSCTILKLEYTLKVVLDVSLIGNTEVKLPIIVMRESTMLQEQNQRESLFG
ncbi:arrestin domain-containing protein 3-like [Periophthalmus magnuspinnatus]|uniref:arrestin domain-containing protein 3-like n=1 Tax=Periophthalmus magnuspinnatus TaxID=409849 RepID=UPI0024372DB8|nr:arrestin domain-containing protein 3-like [Periophthalmus magnuspinnatus]